MNERLREMRDAMLDGSYHHYRQPADPEYDKAFTESLAARGLSPALRASARLADVLRREKPTIIPGEMITMTRTVTTVPEIFTPDEREARAAAHRIHELGKVCNVSPAYAPVIAEGLEPSRARAVAGLSNGDPAHHDFLQAVVESIDAVLEFADRYAEEATRQGRTDLAEVLTRATRTGAKTLLEAMQVFRVLHFALWTSYNYHNTIGRFDLDFWPYLEADLREGRLTEESAFDVVTEFFLSFNRDSDLYPGVQQGDNGQSFVLSGVDPDGKPVWNMLTDLSLKASLELGLIDPKLNLRVSNQTSLPEYVKGTELTARGLGFPQYSNDDIVIPGLVDLGYSERDARNYVVAACWEFIIPGVGMDVPNIAALSFPAAVDAAVRTHLAKAADFDEFMDAVRDEISTRAVALAKETAGLEMEPAPWLSVLMPGCIERGRDASEGLKYNNYGIHGAGLSTATDAIVAIRREVFEDHKITAQQLIEALDTDFTGHDDMRQALLSLPTKLGNDEERTNTVAADLLHTFADALAPLRNDRGGVFRAGTGSAMYYVTAAAELGATPDGRKAGEYLSANLAPSLGVKVRGPLSLLRSFEKLPLRRAINGGPVTIEVHDTVFRTPSAIEKVAMLVRSFVQGGGHQLQINAINRDVLLDAQLHPERHRNLIVRVWGWSAYFIELDKQYQDQIIQRIELVP